VKRGALTLLIFSLLSAAAAGQTLSGGATLNWERGELVLDIRLELGPELRLRPTARSLAEAEIEKQLPALFLDAVTDLPLDSYTTLGERLEEDPELFRRFQALGSAGKKSLSRFSPDLGHVEVRYTYSFYGEAGLIVPLIRHTRARPLPRVLGFVPARSFTGLVIYAEGAFPAHGKSGEEAIRPALLPDLYDEDMNLICSAADLDPAALARWGMTAYVRGVDRLEAGGFDERVGLNPLRTMARGVFGRNSTDIILPREVARQLLSRNENQLLLQQGRILVILSAD
jgi:hypothetical protein